jgi:hypothetical protein
MCATMDRPTVSRTRALLVAASARTRGAQSAGLIAISRVSQWLLFARARLSELRQRRGRQAPQRSTGSSARAVTNSNGDGNGSAKSEDVAELIAQLRDPSAEVASVAALKLGSKPTPEATFALREVLKNVDGYFSPLTRVAALQAFTHSLPSAPGPNELEPLLELVRDIDAEVSMAAIDAIAQRAPSSIAIERLLPVVLDDSGYFLPIVRAAATRALERAGLLTTASA